MSTYTCEKNCIEQRMREREREKKEKTTGEKNSLSGPIGHIRTHGGVGSVTGRIMNMEDYCADK
jgi:hypothetical protein